MMRKEAANYARTAMIGALLSAGLACTAEADTGTLEQRSSLANQAQFVCSLIGVKVASYARVIAEQHLTTGQIIDRVEAKDAQAVMNASKYLSMTPQTDDVTFRVLKVGVMGATECLSDTFRKYMGVPALE
ncbi:hypothetical protein QCE47_27135 [Caballeronia sp. LZ025]|uniref:hypothetical protein n=1 Tax=Caballeronia TaxID=1827195 RepID=UPI001FD6012C|nr:MULTISPECIES: hypothetical protein [Caballeronia]MDR5735993.1 hypothetical protein [Caballeronia sp. LZ025]